MTSVFTDPTELTLEISLASHSEAWQQSQAHSTADRRWCAYLNRICLDAILDLTQTDWVSEPAIAITALPAIWEVVSGSLVLLDKIRVALIPSEAIDDRELAVPQEWVDLPSWAADYYFAIQVKPDEDEIRVWGYTTHQDLKTFGQYDGFDRTYCLDASHITKDLAAFGVTSRFCQNQIRVSVAPLARVNPIQSETLLQRLSQPRERFPRLAIPFSIWGALIENEQWRQTLYQQRINQQRSVQTNASVVNLRQWFEDQYEAGWQALESLFAGASVAFSTRSLTNTPEVQRAKLIDLGMQLDSRSLVLLIALIPGVTQTFNVQVQLHPVPVDRYLPAQVKLALLDEFGDLLQVVQARQNDDYIQLSFQAEVGEGFRLQVSLNELQITEHFTI